MEWVFSIVTGLGVIVLLTPLLLLLGTIFVLAPLAHLMPAPATVARASFDCPFAHRRVNVGFLSEAGAGAPTDVLSCSVFADDRIRCEKRCLGLARTGWTPSAMVPRYSLVADGVAFRSAN